MPDIVCASLSFPDLRDLEILVAGCGLKLAETIGDLVPVQRAFLIQLYLKTHPTPERVSEG